MSKIRLLLAAAVILGLSAAALRAAQPPTGQAAGPTWTSWSTLFGPIARPWWR